MTRLLWLPDKLAEWGVPYQLVDGWERRGADDIDARIVVGHHDAFRSSIPGDAVVRGMVNGRPDLAGPLCNLWIDDDWDLTAEPGDPIVYVIASGRSNNAGAGTWAGWSGNPRTVGIEARNNGLGEIWSARMRYVYELCSAAVLDGLGQPASMWCGHKEYARPLGRKIDPAGIDCNDFRDRVAALLASGPRPAPAPNPALEEDDDMPAVLVQDPKTNQVWIVRGQVAVKVRTPDDLAAAKFFGAVDNITDAQGNRIDGTPILRLCGKLDPAI